MKNEPIRYERSVTFGRFNIGHSGHVELIRMMLHYGEEAHVHVSSGEANNDWDTRVFLLAHLCREAKLDMSRVKFLKTKNPFDAVEASLKSSVWGEAVIVLGSDQVDMAYKLADVYDCATVINCRTNSSTQMRFFLDAEDFREDLTHLYKGDEYATVLAMILRREELSREKSQIAANSAA
jgi:nicotinamide mononucleotide adenylyltransferase